MFKNLGNYFARVLILGFLLVPVTVSSSFAQEAQPGDVCIAGESGWYRRSSMTTATNGGNMLFCNGSNWLGLLSFTSSGNLGVWNASPATELDVIGDGTMDGLFLRGEAGNAPVSSSSPSTLNDLTDVTITTPANTEVLTYNGSNWVNSAAGGGGGGLWTAGAGNDIYYNSGTAKVGIGVTTPDVELDVIGDIEYTGTITDMSDRRLKMDIANLPAGQLEKLLMLQAVSFKMKNDEKAMTELGFIAQDVQPHYPGLVYERSGGMLSMNYVGLIAPMIQAMKEQQAQIEALQARIDTLEQK